MITWPDFKFPPINLWNVPHQKFLDELPPPVPRALSTTHGDMQLTQLKLLLRYWQRATS